MAPQLAPRAFASLTVSKHQIDKHGLVPNTSIQHKPLLIYRAVFANSSATTSAALEEHFSSVGVVVPHWRYTMYSTSHFHSTTHEVLGIGRGKARLCFGGEKNPGRVETVVERGDVIVIPAGVAHRLLGELGSGDDDGGAFEMVGCYPPGKQWDMCYGKTGEESKIGGIKDLPWFDRDPVYGEKGPVLDV